MRFKVYFNERTNELDINCLADNFICNEVIIPENLDQHVQYPIPNDLINEIKKYMIDILSQEDAKLLEDIKQQMINLSAQRRDIIYRCREKYNPLILEKCERFKEDHAEWFI